MSRLAGLKLIAPPGTRPSYSQAGFNLAGRIVEKVTGLTYEKAVASLVFSPAGLPGSFFDRDDVMTRRFAVGHNRGEDGARAREVAGSYENEAMTFTIGIAGAGQRTGLRMEVRIKPEIRAAADKEPPPDPAPFEVGLLPRDEYIVTDGEYAGQRGFFTRDASGEVTGVDLAGRLASRI